MSIDTNAQYKPPKEYEPKNKDFVPKTKPTSVVMIIIGGILSVAAIVGVIIAIVIGVTKIVEAVQNNNKQDENKNQNPNALIIEAENIA